MWGTEGYLDLLPCLSLAKTGLPERKPSNFPPSWHRKAELSWVILRWAIHIYQNSCCRSVICWHETAGGPQEDSPGDPHILVAPGLSPFRQIFSSSLLQNAPRLLQSVGKSNSWGTLRETIPRALFAPEMLGSGMEPIYLVCLQGSKDTPSYLFSCALTALPPLGSELYEAKTEHRWGAEWMNVSRIKLHVGSSGLHVFPEWRRRAGFMDVQPGTHA